MVTNTKKVATFLHTNRSYNLTLSTESDPYKSKTFCSITQKEWMMDTINDLILRGFTIVITD